MFYIECRKWSLRENVSIEGYVLNPGDKPYRTGMTVFDLLFLGGGFENS